MMASLRQCALAGDTSDIDRGFIAAVQLANVRAVRILWTDVTVCAADIAQIIEPFDRALSSC